MLLYALLSLSASLVAGEDYFGAVPCPSDSSIVGYTDIARLNDDIFSHFKSSLDDNASHIKYNYVICPDTTYTIQDLGQTILPATDETTFSCGTDGSVNNNCIIKGGDFHVYFADYLSLIGITFRGFTFDGAEVASVYGDAHPISSVLFEDCVWRNIKSDFVAYVHFTPYTPSGRRLIEGGSKLEFERPEIKKYEALYRSKVQKGRERKLQENIRSSMLVFFNKCVFENNVNRDAVIFSAGAEIGVFDSSFTGNKVERYAVFTTVLNGHVYVGGSTQFLQNEARLGSVFISSDSFLQYNSEDASGDGNSGKCDSIFIEEYGSNCIFPEESDVCEGKCCEFSDSTCDLAQKIELAPSSTSSSVNSEKGGCTGFCLAFAIVLPLLVLFVFGSFFLCLRIRRIRKKNEAEAKIAAANDINVEMTTEIS